MFQNVNHVYQFRIVLEGSSPKIWRRIQIPEFSTFWSLHVAIQNIRGCTSDNPLQALLPALRFTTARLK